MWKTSTIEIADKIGERAEPCLISMSTLKNWKEKLFQLYHVFLPTR